MKDKLLKTKIDGFENILDCVHNGRFWTRILLFFNESDLNKLRIYFEG